MKQAFNNLIAWIAYNPSAFDDNDIIGREYLLRFGQALKKAVLRVSCRENEINCQAYPTGLCPVIEYNHQNQRYHRCFVYPPPESNHPHFRSLVCPAANSKTLGDNAVGGRSGAEWGRVVLCGGE